MLGPVGTALVVSAIAVGGSYAITALVPPAEENQGLSSPQDSDHVTGDSNRLDQYSFVPIVLARRIRMVPDHYARPYSEAAGDNTYWRMLLCVGQGPLNISKIRASDTLISTMPDDYDIEVRQGRVSDAPLTLFTKDVFEVNPSSTLGELHGGEPNAQIQTTQSNTTEITIDVTLPRWALHMNKINRDPYTVEYTLAIRPTGAGTWTDFVTGGSVRSGTRPRRPATLFARASGVLAWPPPPMTFG